MSRENTPDWQSLLIGSRSNDSAARDALFKALEVRLMPVVQYSLRGWSEMNHREILSSTLVVVLEKLPEIQDNPHFFALAVLKNKIGDALRSEKIYNRRHVAVAGLSGVAGDQGERMDPALLSHNDSFAEKFEKQDFIQAICDSITDLPLKCRAIFLGLLEHRTILEIWEHQSSIEPTLKRATFDKRIFDCRKKLRIVMKDHLT